MRAVPSYLCEKWDGLLLLETRCLRAIQAFVRKVRPLTLLKAQCAKSDEEGPDCRIPGRYCRVVFDRRIHHLDQSDARSDLLRIEAFRAARIGAEA